MTDPEESAVTPDEFYETIRQLGRPVLTATDVARIQNVSQATARVGLEHLAETGVASRVTTAGTVVWYPSGMDSMAETEHVVVFPKRREIVVDQPEQFTRARLASFASLVTTNGEGGYVYEIRAEDIWNAPYDDLAALRATVRSVLGREHILEEFLESQFERARTFRLVTHEEGYTVLEARSADLMANVARQALDADVLRAPISETESWVAEEMTAQLKRTLYEAGYPVEDNRDLETGEPLELALTVSLRPYQQTWVDRFIEKGAGVLVGPPGSGKTIAAMGIIAAVGGETLVLVPSRELAAQWHEALLEHTSLSQAQIGEYHGGEKEIRQLTIATYHSAGMPRHRLLFDKRRWGLVIYDEVQHVPSNVFRRSTNLQAVHRLGLSASPVREDDREEEIYTLVGPPIGTDWSALFDAGYVIEPTIEIRYVPWDDRDGDAYAAATGHERRQLAATNPAKVGAVDRLLQEHPDLKALVFVEYLDQGRALETALGVPFVSGETPHAERERLFADFREDRLDVLVVSRVADEGIDLPEAGLAIIASGLGGSRRQGTQRVGRTMRPAGSALVYMLATRGTTEEEFVRNQLRHLSGKGVRVVEGEFDPDEPGSTAS